MSGRGFDCPECGQEMSLRCDPCDTVYTGWKDPGWSGRQLGEVTGVPSRTVQQWVSTSFIEPTERYPPLTYEYVFGFGDAVATRMAHDLMAAEVEREVIGRAVKAFDGMAGRWMADENIWLIVPTHVEAWDERDAQAKSLNAAETALTLFDLEATEGDPVLVSLWDALQAGREAGRRVYGLTDDLVAYDLTGAVELVGERVDRYMRSHHVAPDRFPGWMLG